MDSGLILVIIAVIVVGGLAGIAVVRHLRTIDWKAYN